MIDASSAKTYPNAMGEPQIKLPRTFDEFRAWDAAQPGRYEFVGGEVRAMVGATKSHYRVARALTKTLEAHLSGSRCAVYQETVRLRVAENGRLPDVMVTCDERDHADPLVVRYPTFIAEVLSESTGDTDRVEKLVEYCTIDSLQEYLLLDTQTRSAQLHRRRSVGWGQPLTLEGDNVLELVSLDLSCKLATLFD